MCHFTFKIQKFSRRSSGALSSPQTPPPLYPLNSPPVANTSGIWISHCHLLSQQRHLMQLTIKIDFVCRNTATDI